jgi:hypothetical protein
MFLSFPLRGGSEVAQIYFSKKSNEGAIVVPKESKKEPPPEGAVQEQSCIAWLSFATIGLALLPLRKIKAKIDSREQEPGLNL